MSAARLCRCGRPLRDNFTICGTCAADLRGALEEVPWLDVELDTTLTRTKGVDYAEIGAGGSGGSESALPWDQRASHARSDLQGLLVSWVGLCASDCMSGDDQLPDKTLTGLARWLLSRVRGLAQHEAGPDAVDEITRAVDRCRHVIDREPEKWFAGPCAGPDCGADLYARQREGKVTCRECGLVYDVAERRRYLLAEAEDRLATATVVARAVSWLGAAPLTRSRITTWASRGQIVAKHHTSQGPLYRVGDALDLMARDVRRKAAGKRVR